MIPSLQALAGGEAELSAGFAPPPTTTRFDWTGVMMLTASLACSGVVNVTQALVMQKKPSSLRLTLPCTACGMEEFSVLEHGQVSDRPCNIRREGGESLVIGGSSLVILKGREGNPL